jgi:hypothetical protein
MSANYYYSKEHGVYRLYDGDVVVVELPYPDAMTDAQVKKLSQELWDEYQKNKELTDE